MHVLMIRRIGYFGLATVLLASGLVGSAWAASPLTKIQVSPPDVHLNTTRDRQSLVVQATFADGTTQDVTDAATFRVANPALVRLEKNILYPAADGKTTMAIEYQGQSQTIPIEVVQAAADRPISFKLDVMPVFMKAGCNTGSCHGAARGKDGFRLSLFGFDPDGDHYRLTREISGRRINLALPHESLLIEKSVGKVPHTGGKRFDEKSELNATLIRWLEAGAIPDPGAVPEVKSVEIYPPGAVLDGQGTKQRITVRAKYSDGTDRDVTSLAYFMSNNDNSATISQDGVVEAQKQGEAFIMARFETHTVGTQFIVLPKGLQFTWKETPEYNYVDTLIYNKLKKLRIQPSEVCTDEEFLRRVTMDICGVLPTEEEYERFMKSSDPKKRDKLVDELLGRKEFVEMWVMKWAELLQIREVPNRVTYKPMLRYYNWLQERIAGNVPMDKMVQELLGANGGTFTNPATNFYQAETDTLKLTENIAQVFMGMRIQCAQCHNHPFDRWTMNDYYSFASFFTQIGRKGSDDPREQIVFNRGGGEINHPVLGRPLPPKFLGGVTPDVAGKDRREIVAKWLASAENPYFAKNLSNIVWAHFLGRGIIHEVDDVRISNPAVNSELLDELGKRFTSYNYDFKKLVRDICTSRTYQLSTVPTSTNASDDRNFSKATLRRMRAEVMLDAITQVTETKNKFPGLPLGARAVQIANGNTSTYFLTAFGRASRESVCSCEVKMEPNLSQALHMLNGDTANDRIVSGGVIARWLNEKKTPQQIVDKLYIRTLSRKPTPKEQAAINEVLASSKDHAVVLQDIFWSLLNAREFLFNH